MLIKKIAITLLLVCAVTCLKAQTVDEVIAKYLTFTGGLEQWKNVRSIVTSGTYNYGGMAFPFTSYSKAPNLYKFVVPFKGKYFAQAFDGRQGWKIDAFKGETKKTILTGKPAHALANEADVELESPLIDYAIKGHSVELQGKDTINGTLCYKLKLTRKDGDTETYYFSSDNGELVKKQAVAKNAELENGLLDTYFSDYRQVNRIKLPFLSVSKSNDQTILTITVSKVELNKPIPNSAFEP